MKEVGINFKDYTDKMNLGNLVWVFLQGQVEGNNDNTNKKELEDNNLL